MKRFNEWLALKTTKGVGSMTCAYLFFIWSILPLIFPSLTNVVSYVSQAIIQLVLLSVIMVGQDLGGRNAEIRSQQDHETLLAEFQELKEMHQEIHELLEEVYHARSNK